MAPQSTAGGPGLTMQSAPPPAAGATPARAQQGEGESADEQTRDRQRSELNPGTYPDQTTQTRGPALSQGDAASPTAAGAAAVATDTTQIPQAAGRLTRHHRLVRQTELQRVLRKGRRSQGAHLQLICAWQPRGASGLPGLRLGLAVSKGVGNAPARARMRRLLREAFRALRPNWQQGQDVVVSARTPWPDAGLAQVVTELAELALRAGLAGRSPRASTGSAADARRRKPEQEAAGGATP